VADHTVVNLKDDVEDMAIKHGLSPGLESRFARVPLALEQSGLSYFRVAPDFRTPFGHSHGEQEEVYLVTDGSVRVKIDDEVIELRSWDAVRIPPGAMRCFEGGRDGGELVAFGAPNTENKDTEMQPGWWSD